MIIFVSGKVPFEINNQDEFMSKLALTTRIVCIILAIIIFVFADGLRRWYSGAFFAIMGIIILLNGLRRQ